MWSAMMNNGKSSSRNFGSMMTNNSSTYRLNPYWELIKNVFGKSVHTLPAIALAIFERLPLHNPQKAINKCDELREELKQILGKLKDKMC